MNLPFVLHTFNGGIAVTWPGERSHILGGWQVRQLLSDERVRMMLRVSMLKLAGEVQEPTPIKGELAIDELGATG